MQSVADDAPDDEGDPAAGQRDDVEPVAADAAESGLGGQVAEGGGQRALLGQAVREEAALEGDGHGVLAGVAAGVVDADGGAGDEFLGQ